MNYPKLIVVPLSTVLGLSFIPLSVSATNLVINGDFESGNTGFTSNYNFSPASNTDEGQYTIRTNPSPWNPNFVSIGDHTSGSGNMFVGNGAPVSGSVIWQSLSIAVEQNSTYFFEAWVTNICCKPSYTGVNSPATLEFAVLGATTDSLGVIPTTLTQTGKWQFLGTQWNSGANTNVVLRIINQNIERGGNDFAIDDIYFDKVSSKPVPVPAATLGICIAGASLSWLKLKRNKSEILKNT